MFTDEPRRIVSERIRQQDLGAFASILSEQVFTEAAKRAHLRVGRGPLNAGALVWLSIASALHNAHNFAQVLGLGLKILGDLPGGSQTLAGQACQRAQRAAPHRKRRQSKHDPRGGNPCGPTEEAFAQARRLVRLSLWEALMFVLIERFERQHGERLRFKQFRLMALDGTCLNLPAWKPLRDHFGSASNGRGKRRTTQARLVLLQFPTVRLPYRYALTPLRQGERTVAAGLLTHLRENDLILMDRGFWSYGLFRQITQQNAFFAIRKMKGVRMRTFLHQGPGDRLVRWTPADRQWKRDGVTAAMTLRVIDYQIRGFRPSAVVTSVLDPAAVSRDEWVRMATDTQPGRTLDPGLYHRRWEIETTFSELKVRQGLEGGLRSRTPESLAYEVAGHILLYLLIRWLMVEAAQSVHVDPLRLSFLNALRELIDLRPAILIASASFLSRVLLPRLLSRVAAHFVPFRPGRHFTRPLDTRIRTGRAGVKRLPSKLIRRQT